MINALHEVYITKKQTITIQNFVDYGRHRGWLEEQDVNLGDGVGGSFFLDRRSTARIIHEFLRIEFAIPELRDWSHAHKLKDLYDCRVCAKHVAQMVERNIMPPLETDRFMLLRPVSEAELPEIINRINKVIDEQ